MAVRIGVSGTPACCKNAEDGIRWLAERGLHEEVEFVYQVYMKPADAKKIGELAKSLGVELSVHAPYYINLCNPAKLAASEKRILDSCDRAEKMGATVVVFHPGFYGGDKGKAMQVIKKACADMVRKTSVPLGLETMGRQKQFGTLDEVLEVCREVKGCVPVVDFAHIYARNDGKIDFGEILGKLHGHIHSHFTGVEYRNENEVHHLPVMSKKPDFAALVKEIKKRKSDITIICESPLSRAEKNNDAVLMKKIYDSA